jgi:hypothetical protein
VNWSNLAFVSDSLGGGAILVHGGGADIFCLGTRVLLKELVKSGFDGTIETPSAGASSAIYHTSTRIVDLELILFSVFVKFGENLKGDIQSRI